ncbi:hypothetical protein [Saccharomonospora iraqiensis]|nr:hypothetical protein [Saccharomonospora iraqiensis]
MMSSTFPVGVLTYLVLVAGFFYILYFVVRAAVRDGIRQAKQRSLD